MAFTLRFGRLAVGKTCHYASVRTYSRNLSMKYLTGRNSFSNSILYSTDTAQHKFNVKSISIYSRLSNVPQSDKKNNELDEKLPVEKSEEIQVEPKLGLIARFKKMYKEYWYVLVPVHVVTSACWFGGFYYASQSGVDVVAIMQSMGVSDKLVNPLRDSSMGHVAIAYLLYKIATPARYTVTLGGTTISIKYLVQFGYIKPVPTKAEFVQMYKDKKEGIQEKIQDTKLEFKERKHQIVERKRNIIDDYKLYKEEMKNVQKKEVSEK